jgi:hypothetical protein
LRECRAIALDEPEVGESDSQIRVRIDLGGPGPPQLAARLCPRRSVERTGAKEVNDEMKAAGWGAAHLVQSHGPQVTGAIARLLEKLASGRVLETLVPFDIPARQKPRACERTGGLLDDEDASGAIDARNDRANARPFGHRRYGVFLGVGKGGSVPVGNPIVGVAPGVRVGTGVRVGVGDPEGVGQGSGPTRFHV